VAANLHGVVPASLAFTVIEEGAELFDLELPREAVDDAVWHIRKIFKEGAKEPSRAKLDGKAQTAVVAAVGVYEPSIAVIQVEVTGQLFWA
jgi:hypothetical protein